jgi:hypothetical protein
MTDLHPQTARAGAAAADTRLRRERSIELRFVVDADRAAKILSWVRTELPPDAHGGGVHADEYAVTTLYFDTPDLAVFHRRGSYGRAKYRLRRYGRGIDFFVERKLRTRSMLIKRRSVVPADAIDGLLEMPRARTDTGQWFARRIAVRGLQPMCIIAYQRAARQLLSTATGVSRVTVDTDLQASRAGGPDWLKTPQGPLLRGQSVVELKYQFAAPALFKELVERFSLSPDPFSKYRHSVAALGLTSGAK